MNVGKARSLPKSGALERSFTKVFCSLTVDVRISLESFPEKNALAYHEYL
jgi:hypothetical protein